MPTGRWTQGHGADDAGCSLRATPACPSTVVVVARTREVDAVLLDRPCRQVVRDVEPVGKMYGMHDGAEALSDRRFWLADGDFLTHNEAFETARTVVGGRCGADGIDRLPVIGDFVIPPPGGVVSRDFQTLHFDFGLPLVPMVAQDVARYTALYIERSAAGVSATTRLVPLVPLLRQRHWPERPELLARFVAYGRAFDGHAAVSI
jgi:hypothetical protein